MRQVLVKSFPLLTGSLAVLLIDRTSMPACIIFSGLLLPLPTSFDNIKLQLIDLLILILDAILQLNHLPIQPLDFGQLPTRCLLFEGQLLQ